MVVLAFYCCMYSKLLQSVVAQNNTISQPLWVRNFGAWLSWVLFLRASHGLQTECLLGLLSHQKALLRRIHFQSEHSCVYWQDSVPCGLVAGGFPWFLAAWASPERLSQHDSKQRTSVRVHRQDGNQSFCNLTTKVASHHFYHNLFFRSESQGTAHTQEEGSTQRRGVFLEQWSQ